MNLYEPHNQLRLYIKDIQGFKYYLTGLEQSLQCIM
jgi:hypothetical protein